MNPEKDDANGHARADPDKVILSRLDGKGLARLIRLKLLPAKSPMKDQY